MFNLSKIKKLLFFNEFAPAGFDYQDIFHGVISVPLFGLL
jgi:hypothetical protein